MINIEKLQKKIEACGYTSADLSAVLKLSKAAFYKRLAGEREFKCSEICQMAKLLSLSSDEIDEYFFANGVSVLETI